MTLASWLSLVLVCFLGAASPGPSLVVVLRHSMTGSRLQGVTCALSHAAGVGLYALLTVLGLAVVIAARPGLYLVLATVGAFYLAWLGVQALRNPLAREASVGGGNPAALPAAIRDGFMIALLNPKIALFFLALFSQFVGPDPSALETAVLSLTALSVDAAWYLLVALVLAGTTATDRLRRRPRLLSVLTGGVLLTVSAWTLVRLWLA